MNPSSGQILEQYRLERELSDKLRSAPRDRRIRLYAEVYEEFFRTLPHLEQNERKTSPEEMSASIAWRMKAMASFLRPETTYLELGAGDCRLAVAVAARVRAAYAVEVSDTLKDGLVPPANFKLVATDGLSVPADPESVDFAYSNDFIEHLHPEDALEQLRNTWAALRPGGVYLCLTPNRVSGPHDVSRHFDTVATGFHLKEYSIRELVALFRVAGFREFRLQALVKGRRFVYPLWAGIALESLLATLPGFARRALGTTTPFLQLLGVSLVATK